MSPDQQPHGNQSAAVEDARFFHGPKLLGKNLLVRAVTAVILVPLVLWLVYIGGVAFDSLIMLMALALAIEWDGLWNSGTEEEPRKPFYRPLVMIAIIASLGAAVLGDPIMSPFIAVLAALITMVFAQARRENGYWPSWGILYIALPSGALIWLRELDYGFEMVVWLLTVVWTTDIFAYVTGRLIGGPKLAPGISPNKTWAGLIGGAVMAGVAGVLLALHFGAINVTMTGLVAMFIAVIAQGGDLFESHVKRHFGVKDSGMLFPGHGGALDRLDGMMAAAPALVVLNMVLGGHLFVWGKL